MGRLVLHWVCVFALVGLPVGGCGDDATATGGPGGSGDAGGDGGNGGSGGSVTSCEGTVCPCTEAGIRSAIEAGGDDPYTFDCRGRTTVTTGSEIVIDNDVILDGEGNLTVDGDEDHRVFVVAEVTVQLQRLTVSRGHSGRGGGITNYGTLGLTSVTVSDSHASAKVSVGGGIYNSGTLTLTNSTLSGNSAYSGGGIHNAGTATLTNTTVSGNTSGVGGGMDNHGTATLTNTTVSGNTSWGGGGISNYSTLTLTNTTVSGNTAPLGGGGIYNFGGRVTLTNSTVSRNTAVCINLDFCGGNSILGGGIRNDGTLTLTLTNSIVSGNVAGSGVGDLRDDNCFSEDIITSNGYNIESPGDTCGFDQEGDQANVTEEELNLGLLRDNRGPTRTHALLPGSVAIDAIPADMCELDGDQRGEPRPGGTMCDVGAFEVQEGSL